MIECVVEFALQKLDQFVTQEASLILGVKEQFIFLHDELEWIKCFLKDAETKRSSSKTLEVWVRQIRDLSYDVEDVIDAFILHTEQQQRRNYIVKKMKFNTDRSIAKQIEHINKKIEKITSNKSKYIFGDPTAQLIPSAPTEYSVPRSKGGESNFRELDQLVFREEANKLAEQLTKGVQESVVISIWGMGGLGKTTLAKMVYNKENVVAHFHTQAWITVSLEYRAKDLLQNLIKKVVVAEAQDKRELDNMKDDELCEVLSKHLKEKRYLVVVDDIWSERAWDEIKSAFPSGNGSRIMVTTRKNEVASRVSLPSDVCQLALLDEEQSWDLFCRKVFNDSNGCPPMLENKGKEIVGKCGRLPLAIVVLGGLLMGREKTEHVWSNIASSANWKLTEDSNQCREVLALSYNDLPYYLKSCFLYLGLFPEDFDIPAEKLILLWVAEGFVQQRGEEKMEDVAEDCLEDLIQRSMIQVTKRKYNGRVESCRVHDLFRELAISESQKDRFLGIYGKSNSVAKPRRLAFSSVDCEYGYQFNSNQSFRSLLFFRAGHKDHLWDSTIVENIKMLRVLDLDGVVMEELSKEIGKLILLKYLGLRGTRIPSLPSSLENLVNLQTLDLRGTAIKNIPRAIWKMKQLRHLYGISYLEWQSGKLNLLETHDPPKDLLTLQLPASRHMGKDLSRAILKCKSLRSLSLAMTRGTKSLPEKTKSLPELSISDHQNINELNLYGALVEHNLPSYFPPNLVELNLSQSNMEGKHMEILQNLRNLKVLCLGFGSYLSTELIFPAQSFTGLEVLRLIGLEALEKWKVEKGAMPKLRHLVLGLCPKLCNFPRALNEIETLRKFDLLSMPKEYYEKQVVVVWKKNKPSNAEYTHEGEWWHWSAPLEREREELVVY